jgi:hypothetical protein
MLCTFSNGSLRKIHVLQNTGTPYTTKTAANTLEMAKNFLADYEIYSKNSFYGDLNSMLDKVDANKNSTATFSNEKLEVTMERGSTTFRWKYTYNGIEAPNKCIASRYENGFLKYFVDYWSLYKIGSTTIDLSEEEAINIAMEHAKTYSWPELNGTKFNVANGMVIETIFAPSLYTDSARSSDLLELYPMRHVWVSLDKFYPGNVYGINVHVWADTKKVGRMQEQFSTMDSPADLMSSPNEVEGNLQSSYSKSNSIKIDSAYRDWAFSVCCFDVDRCNYMFKQKEIFKAVQSAENANI